MHIAAYFYGGSSRARFPYGRRGQQPLGGVWSSARANLSCPQLPTPAIFSPPQQIFLQHTSSKRATFLFNSLSFN